MLLQGIPKKNRNYITYNQRKSNQFNYTTDPIYLGNINPLLGTIQK